jgi:hypothetical protein
MNFCSPLGEQFLQESEDHIGGTVSISKLHHCLSPLFLGAVYSGGGWEVKDFAVDRMLYFRS